MAGGEGGMRGLNLLLRLQDPQEGESLHRAVSLGGKNTVEVTNGDRLKIFTPGGGGYGPYQENSANPEVPLSRKKARLHRDGGSLQYYTSLQESV